VTAVDLAEVAGYLDGYLRIAELPDSPGAANGLEVANQGQIGHVIAAVDACQASVDYAAQAAARREAPPLLLVHHGLFWDGTLPVTGRRYRRLRQLLTNDVAVYAAHIPLDLHPEVGNNVVLAGELGLPVSGWFGDYHGVSLGVWGNLAVSREALAERLRDLLQGEVLLIPGGPATTGRVGVITGAGGSMTAQARAAGLDTLITGEGAHHTYFDAMEEGVNLLYGGHYATEQCGVKALARHLAGRFGLSWEFHHHPTGL
jgi:dinuclear metal center YbgI/SA1388 family protein